MNALEIVRLLLGTVSLILATIISACNAYIVLTYLRRGHASSFIPFVGGILGAVGLLMLPNSSFRSACWIPLLLDWGSIPLLTQTILGHMFRRNPNSDIH